MPNTYTELDRVSVSGTSTTTINFTNIPLGYTDLVIVANCGISNADYLNLRAGNGSVNSGSIYSQTVLEGNGSSAASSRGGSRTAFWPSWNTTLMPTSVTANYIINVMNYSNTTTHKTFLSRGNVASSGVDTITCLWNSTAAINTISLYPNSQDGRYFLAGSTFSLYGIANADLGAAKATGGIITEDSQYWYHTFGASGAFIPKQSLSCDVLVVAGGGGAGSDGAGGGGAGGLLAFTSQALTATSYAVTVGAGGPGGTSGTAGTVGVDSQFAALTLVKGGGFGGRNGTGGDGGSGGGGSGRGRVTGNNPAGGSPTSGQGFAGGAGAGASGPGQTGGGGGGAGAVGAAGAIGVSGNGGVGTSTYSSWGIPTGIGQNVSGTYFLAGGGGGSYEGSGSLGTGGNGGGGAATSGATGTAGTANTGGGGGASLTGYSGGDGGSGVVIVRYAK
jgi:hypothetical protein